MFDVDKFLTEELGLQGDAVAAVRTHLAPVADKIGAGYLRQSDYSSKMNDVKAKEDAYAAANDRLNRDIAEWSQLTASEKKNADGLRAQIEESQAEVAKAHNALRKVATDAGLDVQAVFAGLKAAPAAGAAGAAAAPDLTGYAKAGDVQRAVNGATLLALTLPAELIAIADEHFALTGRRLDTRKIAAELQARANTRGNQKSLEPRDVWHEQENIPALQDAAAKAKYDADIKAATEAGRTAALSEMAVPTGGTPHGARSVVFTHPGATDTNKIHKPASERGGLSSAVDALATGKYRQPAAKAS